MLMLHELCLSLSPQVCDWCKHIRHTKEYLDFGAGERRLQFCSAKCLNQYKMDIFYKETQAALPGALCNPGHGSGAESKLDISGGVQLLTPESWGSPVADLRRKIPSPGGPSCASALAPSTSSATSPSDTAAICSPSSSSSAKITTPRPHESPTLPPPPLSSLHPPVGVPPGSPPMVMTPRGPMPLPLFMEHQMMHQMRPPFLRPSHHPAGANSPLSNPMIPGIGPPPPPRTIGPASSPMHRPLLSPHVHPSSGANPGMMPPHPGMPIPGLPPFPPVNMIPNGRIPLPPVMNFGMPSLAPLVPPPTLLVPYPVIVPLPVPIPIPIPIPFSPEASKDQKSGSAHRAQQSSEDSTSGPNSPSASGGSRGDQRAELTSTEPHSPFCSERSGTASVDLTVNVEDNMHNLSLASGLMDGVIDLTVSQRAWQQLSFQKTQPGIQVKVEAVSEAGSPLAAGSDKEGRGNQQGEVGSISQELLSVSDLEGLSYPNILEPVGPPTSKSSPSYNPDLLIKPITNVTPTSQCSTERTLPHSLPKLHSSPAAACNVIVNGSGWPQLVPSPVESCSDRKGDHSTGEVEPRDPINGDLENEALKENNCSTEGKRVMVQEESPDGFEGKADPDSSLEEGEHAYSLPLLSTGGCVVIQPVPKPGADKTAILSCSISAPLSAAVSPELEPPLKRRCLRIRNQNK